MQENLSRISPKYLSCQFFTVGRLAFTEASDLLEVSSLVNDQRAQEVMPSNCKHLHVIPGACSSSLAGSAGAACGFHTKVKYWVRLPWVSWKGGYLLPPPAHASWTLLMLEGSHSRDPVEESWKDPASSVTILTLDYRLPDFFYLETK